MTKVAYLFSNIKRYLWGEAWINAGDVKQHLLSTRNKGFKSPLHMITGTYSSVWKTTQYCKGRTWYQRPYVWSTSSSRKLQCILDMVSMREVSVCRDIPLTWRTRVIGEEVCTEHTLIQIIHIFHLEMRVQNKWYLCQKQAKKLLSSLLTWKFLFHQKIGWNRGIGKYYINAMRYSGIRGSAVVERLAVRVWDGNFHRWEHAY